MLMTANRIGLRLPRSLVAMLVLSAGLALASAAMASAAMAAGPEVQTDHGRLRGTAEEGINVFRGIPYAAPPVGALRWRPPQPAANWNGVRDATAFGPVCPQTIRSVSPDTPQSEDCLTLNIYAPANASAGSLPVMVWIHGGSFRWGAGSQPAYDGVTFAKQGVVLVTINYRLDRLGRFGHPALTRTQANEGLANYGIMDQVAALRWVHDNIASFGGNPQRVTIFGYSAGGVSVNYLMVAPSARGLFQRAISESGGVAADASRHLRTGSGRFKSLESEGLEFAASFGITDDAQAPAKLRALTVKQILDYPQKDFSMNPVVDGTVIPDDLGKMFREGRQDPVPYLAGANSWEASLIQGFNLPMAAVMLGVTPDEARKVYGALDDKALKDTYFGDMLFLAPAWTLAADMQAAKTPAWLYYYSYVDDDQRGKVPGAAHGEEVSHLFRRSLRPNRTLSAHDLEVSVPLRHYWINFARTGNPNGDNVPDWKPFTRATPWTMDFGDKPELLPAIFPKRMAFQQEVIRKAIRNEAKADTAKP
ncbi:MAG: carboxylesterase family protein [Gammaproteobacteria bacterium PRO9]|nr:carboxylesterase family protein [Gammaproteobacteria bacterium PRO9]